MNISEKVAYLKGLVDGLKIDETTNEGKAINAIVDVLDEMAYSINDLEESYDELAELAEDIDQDLGELEEDFYDLEEEDDCNCCDDDELFEVECPSCKDIVYIDDEMLIEGSIDCPNCGEKLEFDFDVEDLDGCCGIDDCDCNDCE